MPDSVQVETHQLRLNGMGTYRKVGFLVLVAGLYLSSPESSPEKILASDSPRKYVTHFLRNVGPKRICDAWRKGLRDNVPNASEQMRARFDTLCTWMRDFHPGDEITETYLPGIGSRIEITGAEMRVIPGKEFADAYFSLALGPKPSLGTKLKRRLLGR